MVNIEANDICVYENHVLVFLLHFFREMPMHRPIEVLCASIDCYLLHICVISCSAMVDPWSSLCQKTHWLRLCVSQIYTVYIFHQKMAGLWLFLLFVTRYEKVLWHCVASCVVTSSEPHSFVLSPHRKQCPTAGQWSKLSVETTRP